MFRNFFRGGETEADGEGTEGNGRRTEGNGGRTEGNGGRTEGSGGRPEGKVGGLTELSKITESVKQTVWKGAGGW